jgi:hypothetical protein
MPIVTTQQEILKLLDGLPMPNGNYALQAYVTPPDPETDYSNPHAYIWPAKGDESRNPASGGAIPRNTGVFTPSGTKPIMHEMHVYLVWFSANDDPDADTWFPGMVDAVMWALRTSPDPLPVTDPYTGLTNSQLVGIGERMTYEIVLRSTEDEAYDRYDALITIHIWEILQA